MTKRTFLLADMANLPPVGPAVQQGTLTLTTGDTASIPPVELVRTFTVTSMTLIPPMPAEWQQLGDTGKLSGEFTLDAICPEFEMLDLLWTADYYKKSRKPIDVEEMTKGFIDAALWSSVHEDGTLFEGLYDRSALAPEAYELARAECADFATRHPGSIALFKRQTGAVDQVVGYDFWLTRCGHGVGFWDCGKHSKRVGDYLAAKVGWRTRWPDMAPYVGDDGKIYLERI